MCMQNNNVHKTLNFMLTNEVPKLFDSVYDVAWGIVLQIDLGTAIHSPQSNTQCD